MSQTIDEKKIGSVGDDHFLPAQSSDRVMTSNERQSWLGVTVSWVPPVLVLCGLAGLAWFGHQYDWSLPAFSAIASRETTEAIPWCDSHGVSEETCIVCDPSLIESPPKLEFCNEHGVHGCVLHHPELAETKSPTIPTMRDLQRASEALALMPRAENLPLSSSAGSRIQFASIEAMNKAGVDVEPVERRPITEAIEASGESNTTRPRQPKFRRLPMERFVA